MTLMPRHPLEPPDLHYLNAAIGWLALGSRADALAELDQISPEQQQDPDVLEVRWEILAKEKQWDAALDVARKLLSHAPERASSWLHHAYALRRAPDSPAARAGMRAGDTILSINNKPVSNQKMPAIQH